ncbi:carboxymuconolactone decarboxylase family protein [Rubrobacter aplysinae]|uniref:carboxymuconolactone decarboxylase family protein n=1 Tax=Rubrobacter aplysinae TaxID=909625 RepID=UPI00064BBA8B|nr:carboxymuconolactone decarboxylase family protein [Rubrobacter aplysinae]
MPRILFVREGATPFERLMGHNPQILARWSELEDTLLGPSRLGAELKEQVRRTLAFGNRCEYCMVKGMPAEEHLDRRQRLAVDFARQVVEDHLAVEDQVFTDLREHFVEAEIAELCALVCFLTASQRFGALLKLQPDSDTK